jgi:hypothetical protein
MSPINGGLMQLLGPSGTQGVSAAGGATLNPAQVAGADFTSLLQQARTGGMSSGRAVTVSSASGVKLSLDQLQRVADAADRAEAQGATRALVLIDGMALRVDLTARQVTNAVDLSKPGVTTGIDSIVSVPSVQQHSGAAVMPLPRGNAALGNPSLLKALAGAKAGTAN